MSKESMPEGPAPRRGMGMSVGLGADVLDEWLGLSAGAAAERDGNIDRRPRWLTSKGLADYRPGGPDAVAEP